MISKEICLINKQNQKLNFAKIGFMSFNRAKDTRKQEITQPTPQAEVASKPNTNNTKKGKKKKKSKNTTSNKQEPISDKSEKQIGKVETNSNENNELFIATPEEKKIAKDDAYTNSMIEQRNDEDFRWDDETFEDKLLNFCNSLGANKSNDDGVEKPKKIQPNIPSDWAKNLNRYMYTTKC